MTFSPGRSAALDHAARRVVHAMRNCFASFPKSLTELGLKESRKPARKELIGRLRRPTRNSNAKSGDNELSTRG
jgi:hypothetical protein